MPALEAMLSGAGAVIVQSDGLYRIVPAAAGAGSLVVPLRYTSADELAKVLQPLVAANGKIVAETSLNTMLLSGDPGHAQSMAELVRVVPLTRMNAVLVVSSQPRYIDAARRVFDLIERERRRTVRVWHAYYLQNSNANDVAYTLQMAFTPQSVTAFPPSAAHAGSRKIVRTGAGSNGSDPNGTMRTSGLGACSGGGGGFGTGGNPLLGGIDPAAADPSLDSMRILPNGQNSAILVYGTAQEEDTIAAMLRKIDIFRYKFGSKRLSPR